MNTGEVQFGDILRRIYTALKRNIIVFIATILVAVAIGGVFAYTRTPVYTAQNKLHYGIVPPENDDSFNYSANQYTARYYNSMITFCTQSKVADRADYYFTYYVLEKDIEPTLTKEEFFAKIERAEALTDADRITNPTEYAELIKYKFTKEKLQQYTEQAPKNIKAENISSVGFGTKEDPNYTIAVSYSDTNKVVAEYKVAFVIEAIKLEFNYGIDELGNPVKYFGDFTINVIDYGANAATKINMSTKQIILISGVLGLALACLFIYIITASNHTITEKEEIERITGVNILSYISNKGGLENA